MSGVGAPKGAPKGSSKATPKASGSVAAKKTNKTAEAGPVLALDAASKKLLQSVGTAPQALDELKTPSVFPLGALEKLSSKTRAGQVFRLDGGFLDALRLQVRKVKFKDGEPGYQLEMKIAGPSRARFAKRLEQKGAEPEPFSFFESKLVEKSGVTILEHTGETHALGSYYSSHAAATGHEANNALRLEGTGWQLDFVPDGGPIGVRGSARILLTGKDAACNAALLDLIQKVGLHQAFSPPTPVSIQRYKLMKLLWHMDPKEAAKLSKKPLDTVNVQSVKTALKAQGVSEARIKQLRYEEVAPGHFTVVDPLLAKELVSEGLRYAYSTVDKPEHVLSILEHGQKATLTRWSEGALISGMSSMADVGSGGAQGVFSRLVTDSGHGESWNGRRYRIVLVPELLGRLDVWGWDSDMFGQSWNLTKANFGARLLNKVGTKKGAYNEDNEIVSPVGNSPKYIACVTCANAHDRKALLLHLKSKGYKPPHGKSLENLVRLEPNIRANLLGGKAPKIDKHDDDDY